MLGNKSIIQEKLGKQVRDIRAACIAFPREVLETDYELELLLKTWQIFHRKSVKVWQPAGMRSQRVSMPDLRIFPM